MLSKCRSDDCSSGSFGVNRLFYPILCAALIQGTLKALLQSQGVSGRKDDWLHATATCSIVFVYSTNSPDARFENARNWRI